MGLIWLVMAGSGGAQSQVENPAAKALLRSASEIAGKDRAAALAKIEQALALLQAPGASVQRHEALSQRCWLRVESETEAAIQEIALALEDASKHNLPDAVAELRLCRGYAYEQQQKNADALREYEFCVAEGTRLRNRKITADARVLRGEMRHLVGDYAEALDDFKRAYDDNLALKRASKVSYALNAIANLYADANVGEYDQAIDYYRQLLKAHETNGNQREVATATYNLASTFERKKDFSTALKYFRETESMEQRLKRPLDAAYAQRSVGIVLTKLGRASEALAILDGAIKTFTLAGDSDRLIQTRLSRGITLRQLGRHREALDEFQAARSYFEKERNDRFLEKIHDERALAHAALGEWKEALIARELHTTLVRTLGERVRAQQTARLRVEFDSERKEHENRALTEENELRTRALADALSIQRLQWLALGSGLVALFALAALGRWYYVGAQRMRNLAMTDELTRLPNRRHLLTLAEAQVARARGGDATFAILALDIDHFKRINDNFGHDAGDKVLQRIARACQAALRANDSLGRTGGEEFVALLPASTAASAAEVGERVRIAALGVSLDDIEAGLRVSVSIGLAEWKPEDRNFGGLLKRADEALYHAKEAGRNRLVVASADLPRA